LPDEKKRTYRAEAEALADSLFRSHKREVLEELRKILQERLRRSAGRPKGKELIDDSARLQKAEALLSSGEAADEEEAARIVAAEDPADNERATRRRVRDKLRSRQAQRFQERSDKDEIMERAFAEEVEQWDLRPYRGD
jgi:hypothetical protein